MGSIILFSFYFVQKRDKRSWIFKKPTNLTETLTQQNPTATKATIDSVQAVTTEPQLRRPVNQDREVQAAIVIQTAFRGYLVIVKN